MADERTIAGHRVLRLLGRGERSSCWLAPGDLVLKVLDASAPGEPAREAQALHRAAHDHVVALADISVQPGEVVFVLPRLPRGSLAELLSARRTLDAGEAVTILAPLAAALQHMHEAGVSHGAVSAEHVLFRDDGAPVLIGSGSMTVFEQGLPEVVREQVAGVVADRRALAALAVAVLGRVSGTRAAAAQAFAAGLEAAEARDLESRIGRGLFELAAARPVVFDAPEEPPAEARAIGVRAVPEPPAPELVGPVTRLLALGPAVVARERVLTVWNAWSPQRRRLALAAGAAALVLVVAVAAIPSAEPPVDAPPAADAAAGAAATPDAAANPEAVVPPLTPDDPLEALNGLLARRDDCLRDLSMLCLDEVDERGSAALDDDRGAIQAIIAEGEQPPHPDARGAMVVERLGDSVLVDLAPESQPASVLLMKGEAGWRIRDYIARMD